MSETPVKTDRCSGMPDSLANLEALSPQQHQQHEADVEQPDDKKNNHTPNSVENAGDGAEDTKPKSATKKSSSRPWTIQENQLFYEGYKQYGRQWSKINTLVTTRTVQAVTQHIISANFRQYLEKEHGITNVGDIVVAASAAGGGGSRSGGEGKKGGGEDNDTTSKSEIKAGQAVSTPTKKPSSKKPSSKKNWSDEENRLFYDGYKQYGRQWSKIAALIETRTVQAVTQHFESTNFKQYLEQNGITDIDVSSASNSSGRSEAKKGGEKDDKVINKSETKSGKAESVKSPSAKSPSSKESGKASFSSRLWSDEENGRFFQGVKQHGRHWAQVTDVVESRTLQAVSQHINSSNFRQYLQKQQSIVEDEEDSNLISSILSGQNVKTPSKQSSGTTATNTSKTSATSSAPKSKTYVVMVHEAIKALKGRSGSSQAAITKYVASENPDSLNSAKFKSNVSLALKSGVKSGRFIKIKASFKINPEWTKKEKAKQRALDSARRQKDKKRMEAEEKLRQEERERKRKEEQERKQREKEASMTEEELSAHREKLRLKKEAEARAIEIAERIRKRKFPMEDSKLHEEDKELGVKPPDDVKKRPALPYFFMSTIPFDKRKDGKTPSSVIAASRNDSLDFGSRGLVSDMMQVYHFFRGDVAYKSEELVPEFTMKNLVFAVDEILNGNAKRSRMVPPLISHLFVCALRLLTEERSDFELLQMSPKEKQQRIDISSLASGLGPSSFGEICFLYMDAMERYYTSMMSVDSNVLPGGHVDMKYLMRVTDTIDLSASEVDDKFLPAGYNGYLGDPRSSLSKAHAKLETKDPWNLTAEELMALLRALTDDIFMFKEDLSEDVGRRDDEMYELLKNKRNADSNFRKVRLAFEGPKRIHKSKAEKEAEKAAEDKKSDAESEGVKQKNILSIETPEEATTTQPSETKKQEEQERKFKPTATKKQYETATKAKVKADDAYEKGLKVLVSRRVPIGYDRNFNAVYFFHHDPDMLYVEVSKSTNGDDESDFPMETQTKKSNWHVIETKTLFDQYGQSLDIRGTREKQLYEALVGPEGGSYSLRRFMFDDMKEKNSVIAMQKEREDLERRLANARVACAAEEAEGGRRSGRLASRAQIELCQVEEDIKSLERRMVAAATPKPLDYEELTGLEMLRKFDNVGRRETRRKREAALSGKVAMPCSILCGTGNIDGSGLVGSVVSEMLQLEEICESFCSWERHDIDRKSWISKLEDVVFAWNNCCSVQFGPGASDDKDDADAMDDTATPTQSAGKRRRTESPSAIPSFMNQSVPQILAMLRSPLLELEHRVCELSGLLVASRDADLADDNMSINGDDENEASQKEEGVEHMPWKKKVHAMRSIPTPRYGHIRQVLVEAIAAARKVQLGSVVAELRAALLLHHPNAAGECKAAALAVLEKHGGYHQEEDEESGDEGEVDDEEDQVDAGVDEILSILSGEAMMMNGSIKGDSNANRVDWIDAVKECKTISRLSSLAYAFTRNASKLFVKIEGERETLIQAVNVWGKEEERQKRARSGNKPVKNKPSSFDAATEVWADVSYTDDFCMAKLEGFPAWPAKRCKAKNAELSKSLKNVNRELVALVGEEGGLRVVKSSDILPYTGEPIEEDLSNYSKELRTQLDLCIAMARRIIRGMKNKDKMPASSQEEQSGFSEEKKSAS